ncbi:hypothetical protein LRS03_04410 [Rhizobacter sp. J219]|nr:hypothetical protein [Rhizobacter sp. J219]MCR5882141.1 hypothetical protein [Rhizobacter sp. J219]
MGNSLDKPAQQVVFQAAAVLILLSLHHYFNSDTPISSTGALGRAGRIATAGSLGVIAIHVVAFAHAMFFDVPVEPKMMEIRATEGIGAWSRLLLSAVVLAPIWEEALLSSLPTGIVSCAEKLALGGLWRAGDRSRVRRLSLFVHVPFNVCVAWRTWIDICLGANSQRHSMGAHTSPRRGGGDRPPTQLAAIDPVSAVRIA